MCFEIDFLSNDRFNPRETKDTKLLQLSMKRLKLSNINFSSNGFFSGQSSSDFFDQGGKGKPELKLCREGLVKVELGWESVYLLLPAPKIWDTFSCC